MFIWVFSKVQANLRISTSFFGGRDPLQPSAKGCPFSHGHWASEVGSVVYFE